MLDSKRIFDKTAGENTPLSSMLGSCGGNCKESELVGAKLFFFNVKKDLYLEDTNHDGTTGKPLAL